ncbi:uncharacterized protein [Erythrolamprus reginae]|uniref:uncharacterized protein n=1 Tax=Erythrolamprus reginae TaxID=121349 RepID=UPI00396CCCC3
MKTLRKFLGLRQNVQEQQSPPPKTAHTPRRTRMMELMGMLWCVQEQQSPPPKTAHKPRRTRMMELMGMLWCVQEQQSPPPKTADKPRRTRMMKLMGMSWCVQEQQSPPPKTAHKPRRTRMMKLMGMPWCVQEQQSPPPKTAHKPRRTRMMELMGMPWCVQEQQSPPPKTADKPRRTRMMELMGMLWCVQEQQSPPPKTADKPRRTRMMKLMGMPWCVREQQSPPPKTADKPRRFLRMAFPPVRPLPGPKHVHVADSVDVTGSWVAETSVPEVSLSASSLCYRTEIACTSKKEEVQHREWNPNDKVECPKNEDIFMTKETRHPGLDDTISDYSVSSSDIIVNDSWPSEEDMVLFTSPKKPKNPDSAAMKKLRKKFLKRYKSMKEDKGEESDTDYPCSSETTSESPRKPHPATAPDQTAKSMKEEKDEDSSPWDSETTSESPRKPHPATAPDQTDHVGKPEETTSSDCTGPDRSYLQASQSVSLHTFCKKKREKCPLFDDFAILQQQELSADHVGKPEETTSSDCTGPDRPRRKARGNHIQRLHRTRQTTSESPRKPPTATAPSNRLGFLALLADLCSSVESTTSKEDGSPLSDAGVLSAARCYVLR